MGSVDVLREITPLSQEDCFLVMQRPKRSFSYPLHVHPEFELNYLENAGGAIRIFGDSVEEMEELDLLLVAGGTKHAYSNHKCQNTDILEITIQFHASLFDSLINKRHFKTIKDMFEKASCGLVFSREMILRIQPELKKLHCRNIERRLRNAGRSCGSRLWCTEKRECHWRYLSGIIQRLIVYSRRQRITSYCR